MRTLIASLLLLLPSLVQAGPVTNGGTVVLAPGTYAVRSLCPPAGDVSLTAWRPDGNSWFARSDTYCVNGRIGITFTVPDGPALPVMIDLGLQRVFATPKIAINRDCAGGVETTCSLITHTDVDGNVAYATAAGVFTYPGDEDWYVVPVVGEEFKNIKATTKDGCFASGKTIRVPQAGGSDIVYLAMIGGPSGCAYQITGLHRESVPE